MRGAEDFGHANHFVGRVVKVEARARGAGHLELSHERLRAVVTAAEGEAAIPVTIDPPLPGA